MTFWEKLKIMSTNLNQPESSEKYVNNGDLEPYLKHCGHNREEQIKINQKGLELLQKWRQEDAQLTAVDIQEASDTWERVKQTIDENRSRKLFD